jgi:large subunit ribosomal protein L18
MMTKKEQRLRRSRQTRAHREAERRPFDGVPLQPAHLRQRDLRRRWSRAGLGVDRREGSARAAGRGAGKGANVDAASLIGKRIAEKAKAAGVEKVAFDRSGFAYHGRVKALAEAAREAGLQF